MEELPCFPDLVRHQLNPLTGEPCCFKAPKLGKRKRKEDFIRAFTPATSPDTPLFPPVHKPQSKTAGSIIRTGCIPCLNDRVKCDGTNPRCHKIAITEDWRINSDVAWQWYGTWRERRGIHVFVNFAKSPERAGLFESTFWHRTVMLACFSNEAVFHVGSAIGALHEHIYKQSTGRDASDNSGLAFAFQQCNRAISLLTDSTSEQEGTYSDPEIALITCLLFACFEALQGDPAQAITHSLQGRKLLVNCERLEAAGQGSRLLDTTSVRPVMGGLEIQAKALQGKAMRESDRTSDPALPDVSRLHSLDHANWTLHYAYIALLVTCQDCTLDDPPYSVAIKTSEKFLLFTPWLKQWERSFADFLFRDASHLSPHDMQRAKVLKANHITANMLAALDQGTGKEAWEGYESDFRAIIDLSASVLNTYCVGPQATLSTFQFPFLTFGLWVAEPLFITMSRSLNPELRRQAAGLLAGQAKISPFSKSTAGRKSASSNGGAFVTPHHNHKWKDTDLWGNDQWIDFGTSVRLDAGMATYFAKLPSEYIEKPTYYGGCD